MATPPTFIQEAETAWNTNTSPKTTASFSVVLGDVLVAWSIREGTANTPTMGISNSGTAFAWNLQQQIYVTNYSIVSLWTTVASVSQSMTVSLTCPGGFMEWFGGNVLTFRGSDGVGSSSKDNVSGAAPSLDLVTTGDNSAIVCVNGDWNGEDGSSRTWRTINGITPTSGNGLELTYFRDAAHYASYGAYWDDAGAAGSKTTGLSAPGGQKYSIAAVEVLGLSVPPPPPASPTATVFLLTA